ncbi:MAG TPA: MJ0042-type zinc finger domain-containing protein [Hyphomicrobiaceae bacterium]|nr:MJ0042-type zinc finger domain-containing protein [Hyphomicrobiaceae bacterium]
MLIVCPNCTTSYQVEPATLGTTGRSVRCARCKKVWFASNTESMAEISRSFHQDMAAFAAPDTDPGFSQVPERPPTATEQPPIADAPSIAPDGPVASAPLDQPTAPDRDDRGPGPLPEPPAPSPPAQPEAVQDSPPLAPESPVAQAPKPDAEPSVDIETIAARRTRRPPPARRRADPLASKWAIAVLALIALNLGLIGWRTDIVRAMPQMASFYAAIGLNVNLRNLAFADFTTRKDDQDGTPMLIVEGAIKNTSRGTVTTPRLRFAVRNAQGLEIYSWTALPSQTVIAPGATVPFRSRLASPPHETHAVLVRFFNRRDLVAGAK